jgi:isochorismate synthase EntC
VDFGTFGRPCRPAWALGWVTGSGESKLTVVLPSHADLFAVAGSDPDAEGAETEIKPNGLLADLEPSA